MTEKQLIAGCRRGDREAQRELYAQTADRTYRLLLRMTRDSDTAADLMQDTYVRVFRGIEQFQGASSLSTWIYRIAVNEAQQYFRRRTRQEQILRKEYPGPAEVTAGGQEASAVQMDVQAALERLPDEDRILIVLRYFEGLNYAQLSEALEKPPGTIASGLNRARRMLQQCLDPGGGEE